MRNIYFPDEEITQNDLFFVCSMIERVARTQKQRNKYVVNQIGKQGLYRTLSLANVMHSENPEAVASRLIEEYQIEKGEFDITDVDPRFTDKVPTPFDMGKVYSRLILSTLKREEDYADGILRIYNDPICEIIDNYNGSAYYEPSYVLTRSYYNGFFN